MESARIKLIFTKNDYIYYIINKFNDSLDVILLF